MQLLTLLTAVLLNGTEPPLAAPAAAAAANDSTPRVVIAVDSGRHELIITAGPFDLENMPPLEEHAMMDHGAAHDTPVQRFAWPIEGWFRGFKIELADGSGNPVPRHVMHHLIMVNFDRRQLIYSAAERLMGAGIETENAVVPKTIGVPMQPGMDLGLYVAWHNDTGKKLEDVHLKLTMLWTPKNQNPRPANAMPIYLDVNLTVGGSNTFDVPPGKSEKTHEFTLPVGGRLLAVGGHMHDYGVAVRLEEVESGKVLTRVTAKKDTNGKLTGVSRKLFGVSGDGLKLKADRRYRVVGAYDNPTGKMLTKGAMASIVGLFVPDKLSDWPAIAPNDPTFQRDLASLQVRGAPETGRRGEDRNHAGHVRRDAPVERGKADAGHEGHGNPK